MKITIGFDVGAGVRSHCSACKRFTNHSVMSSVRVEEVHRIGDEEWGQTINYQIDHQIVKCLGCDEVGYRRRLETDDGDDPMTSYFPIPLLGHETLKEYWRLPTDVQRVYNETISALTNEQPVLAGVGIRLLIERVCHEKGAIGGNLFTQIEALVPLGVIVADSAQMLHHLRDLGNDSAHGAKAHSQEQLLLALDIVETMLKNVYILPRQAEALRKP